MANLIDTLRQRAFIEIERNYLDFRLPPPLEWPLVWAEDLAYGRPAQKLPIEKPIFIIGCHRSGTTVLYETLAQHPDLVYFTNASSILPRTPILSNLLSAPLWTADTQVERFVKDGLQISYASPSEGIRIWEHHKPATDTYVLDETYHNPTMASYLKSTIQKHLLYFKGTRFINKNPDNSVRLRYLNTLFPDALFIHILRDGRAVCASLLKFREAAAEFFGADHRHATSGVKVKAWVEIEQLWRTEPIQAIGLIWREVLETIDADRKVLPPERFLELRYEDFVQDPLAYLRRIIDFCQLRWDVAVEERMIQAAATVNLGGRNEAWRQRLPPEQVNQLMEIIGPQMVAYGYSGEGR